MTRVDLVGEPVQGVFKETDLHLKRNPRPLSLERYDHVPPGGGRFDLPDHLRPNCWRNKPTGTTDVMGRMRWDAHPLKIPLVFDTEWGYNALARIELGAQGGALVERVTTTRTAKDGTATTTVRERFTAPDWHADGWFGLVSTDGARPARPRSGEGG